MKSEKVDSGSSIMGASIKSLMYGGVDGVITVSSVVASAVGASLDLKIIILIGFSTLIADAFSMSFSDWASSTAERRHWLAELAHEDQEYTARREIEMSELTAIYEHQGMEKESATELVEILGSKPEYRECFLKHMMVQELNLTDPGDPKDITRDACYTALTVMIYGALPLFNYLFFFIMGAKSALYIHLLSLAMCGVSLFSSGYIISKISKQPYGRQCFYNVSVGLTAIIGAFFLGYGLDRLL